MAIHGSSNPFREIHQHGMGKAESQLHGIAFNSNLISHADNFQGFGKTLGHTVNTVSQKRSSEAVLGAGFTGVFNTGDHHGVCGHLILQKSRNRCRKLSLGPFHRNAAVFNGNGDAAGDGDGKFSYS